MDPKVIPFSELDPTDHSHEFIGGEHGDVPFSVILIHTGPGGGPAVHSHPLTEWLEAHDGRWVSRPR